VFVNFSHATFRSIHQRSAFNLLRNVRAQSQCHVNQEMWRHCMVFSPSTWGLMIFKLKIPLPLWRLTPDPSHIHPDVAKLRGRTSTSGCQFHPAGPGSAWRPSPPYTRGKVWHSECQVTRRRCWANTADLNIKCWRMSSFISVELRFAWVTPSEARLTAEGGSTTEAGGD